MTTGKQNKEHLTIQEAAEFVGLSDSTIRRLIRTGELRAFRAGQRRIVIRHDDLVAWLEEVSPGAPHARTE